MRIECIGRVDIEQVWAFFGASTYVVLGHNIMCYRARNRHASCFRSGPNDAIEQRQAKALQVSASVPPASTAETTVLLLIPLLSISRMRLQQYATYQNEMAMAACAGEPVLRHNIMTLDTRSIFPSVLTQSSCHVLWRSIKSITHPSTRS